MTIRKLAEVAKAAHEYGHRAAQRGIRENEF